MNKKWIFPMLMPLLLNDYASASTIYGLANVDKYSHSIKNPIFVQMGSFSTPTLAATYQSQLQARTNYKVSIESSPNAYRVVIGPIYNYTSLKKLAQNFVYNQPTQRKIVRTTSRIPYKKPATIQQTQRTNWFLTVEGGGQITSGGHSTTRINNGSELDPPNNLDIYTADKPGNSTLWGLQLGRRWEGTNDWLNAASLSVHYQYFSNTNINGQVELFSLPEFTNYNYKWQQSSNLVLANIKLNLLSYRSFSPYLNAGVGGVFSRGKYTETALPEVTPRVSPNYGSNNSAEFTFIAGAGLDYQINPSFILSGGYQYSNLGELSTGSGTMAWAAQHLDFGHNDSNAFLLGLTYLFDANAQQPYQK